MSVTVRSREHSVTLDQGSTFSVDETGHLWVYPAGPPGTPVAVAAPGGWTLAERHVELESADTPAAADGQLHISLTGAAPAVQIRDVLRHLSRERQ